MNKFRTTLGPFLTILCVVYPCLSQSESDVINTSTGPVRGKVIAHDDEPVYQFLGIPYAKPPVEKLRFKKPQPMEPWEETLDGISEPPACPDIIHKNVSLHELNISEDCLYLNIYVPLRIESPDSKGVIVWLQGGGYVFGQPSMYDGSHLALNGDVIVVTVNYRLSIFGFLSAKSLIQGNFGLWDQILAFEWIKENIGAFGGNPSFITLLGEGSAGLTASLQSIIPRNEGLFQRVISLGGVALSPLAMAQDTEQASSVLREHLDCTEDTELLSCLQDKTVDELINISRYIMESNWKNWMFVSVFAPCIDGELLTKEPRLLLSDKTSENYKFFRSLDMILGTTEKDLSMVKHLIELTLEPLGLNFTNGLSTSLLCDKLSVAISALYFHNVTKVTKAICNLYKFSSTQLDEYLTEQALLIADMLSDFIINAPTIEMLNLHTKSNTLRRTYQYLFSKSHNHTWNLTPGVPWLTGSHQSRDLANLVDFHIFSDKFDITLDDEDYALSEHLVLYWGNFAKMG